MPAQNLPGLVLDRAHPLSRGLVGWWPMNEGGGARVGDVVGRNSGLASGGPKWIGGQHGKALLFDGTDDFVTIANTPEITIAANMSVSFWTNIVATGGYRVFVAMRQNPPGPSRYEVYLNGTSLRWYNGGECISGYTVTTGVPLFVCVSRIGTSLLWYINGAYLSTVSTGLSAITDTLYIGKDTTGQYISASMWNLRLYNRALDAREVAQLYADPLAGALAPSRLTRFYTVAPVSPPPAVAPPLSSDRLYNRSQARIFRRGETG